MSEFIIKTVDNAYLYESVIPVTVAFNPKNNIRTADTQGFLRKTQKGKIRHDVTVLLKVVRADYENTFLPMLEYPDDVYVTFDRTIPGRDSTSGTFTLEEMSIVQEFDNGDEYEIELKLVEVLAL
jgi:hypothetical protein